MKKLILIRHGRTIANEKLLYCGSSDPGLSPAGKEELRLLRETRVYPDASGFDFYTSGMLRANETLNNLYGNVLFTSVPGFCEMDFGQFEMKSYEELKDDDVFLQWLANKNAKAPGGESADEMKERVTCALKEVLSSDNDALIVSHGGTIAVIMQNLFPGEGRDRYCWQPDHGCGYLIRFETAGSSYKKIPF